MQSRREFGRLVAGGSILLSQFLSRGSLAQDGGLQEQLKIIKQNIIIGQEAADRLVQRVIKQPIPLDISFESQLVKEHLDERRAFVETIAKLDMQTLTLAQLATTDEPQRSAARVVLAFQDRLVPSPDELAEITIPAPGGRECDPVGGILAILIDVIGLSDHEKLMIELAKDTRIQEWAQIIADRAKRNSWEDVVRAFGELLTYLAGLEFALRLGRSAAKAFATRLGTSLVPILGQVYLAIILIAALKKNYRQVLC